MKTRKIFLIDLLFIILFVSGCTFHGKNLNKINIAQDERVRENTTAALVSNQITEKKISDAQAFLISSNYFNVGMSLDIAKESSFLAGDFLNRNQSLVGLPIQPQNEIINQLLSTNKVVKSAAEFIQSQKQKEEISWIKEKSERERALIKMGQEYEIIKNKSIIKRFWGWLVGSFGVLGAVAFIIFCPALAIPILGRLAGWIIGVIPKVANFIGIVSSKSISAIVKGVGSVRNDLKKQKELTPNKTYTAAEVLKMLDTSLAINMNDPDKKIVENFRQTLNV